MQHLMLKLWMIFATLTLSGCLAGGAQFAKKEGVSIKPKGFRVLVYDGDFKSRDPYDGFDDQAKIEWEKFKKAISIRMPEKLSENGIPTIVEMTRADSLISAVSELVQRFDGSNDDWHYLIVGPINAIRFCISCPYVFTQKIFILDPRSRKEVWVGHYYQGANGPKPSLQGFRGKYFNVVDETVDYVLEKIKDSELVAKEETS